MQAKSISDVIKKPLVFTCDTKMLEMLLQFNNHYKILMLHVRKKEYANKYADSDSNDTFSLTYLFLCVSACNFK